MSMSIINSDQIYPSRDVRARAADKARLLNELRDLLNNKPPLFNELLAVMKPILDFGYATRPELLHMVNSSIHPLKIIVDPNAKNTYGMIEQHSPLTWNLIMIDTNDASDELSSKSTQQNDNSGFTIDEQGEILFNGEVIEDLEPKQKIVAVMLINRFPYVATFDELIDGYWNDDVPSDATYLDGHEREALLSNIYDCVSKLRKLFRNFDGREHIKTVRKTGYKFLA